MKSRFSGWYYKLFIKGIVWFYLFIITGIAAFICMCLGIHVDGHALIYRLWM